MSKGNTKGTTFFYKPEEKPPPKLKVDAPISRDDIIHFETPDDFNDYYNKNKAEFENSSTRRLNAKYIIPGYVITVRTINKETKEKELKLMKDYHGTSVKHMKEINSGDIEEEPIRKDKFENLVNKFNELSDRFDRLLKYLLDQGIIN